MSRARHSLSYCHHTGLAHGLVWQCSGRTQDCGVALNPRAVAALNRGCAIRVGCEIEEGKSKSVVHPWKQFRVLGFNDIGKEAPNT
jgi:hypothetical protein